MRTLSPRSFHVLHPFHFQRSSYMYLPYLTHNFSLNLLKPSELSRTEARGQENADFQLLDISCTLLLPCSQPHHDNCTLHSHANAQSRSVPRRMIVVYCHVIDMYTYLRPALFIKSIWFRTAFLSNMHIQLPKLVRIAYVFRTAH